MRDEVAEWESNAPRLNCGATRATRNPTQPKARDRALCRAPFCRIISRRQWICSEASRGTILRTCFLCWHSQRTSGWSASIFNCGYSRLAFLSVVHLSQVKPDRASNYLYGFAASVLPLLPYGCPWQWRLVVIYRAAFHEHGFAGQLAFQNHHAAVRVRHHCAAVRELLTACFTFPRSMLSVGCWMSFVHRLTAVISPPSAFPYKPAYRRKNYARVWRQPLRYQTCPRSMLVVGC